MFETISSKTAVHSTPDATFILNGKFSAYHRSSAAESLLAERGRIDNTHRMTDEILEYVLPCFSFPERVMMEFLLAAKPMKLGTSFPGSGRP